MDKNKNNQRGRRKLYWANLLHFYQPPDQDRAILERVVNESYHPVLKIFEQIPTAKATINIQGCLIELLIKTGFGKVVTRIRELTKTGQIELMVTPRFHPFLPFISDDEADRQIIQHIKICKKYFGLNYNPRGFYSPEMAYNTNIGKYAARYGCRWMPVDEITVDGTLDQIAYDRLYMDKGAGGLVLVPRCRELSEAMAGSMFAKNVLQNTNDFVAMAETGQRKYIFTANDVEQFGHHQKGSQNLLRFLYRDTRLTSMTVSELTGHIRKKEYCKALPADWFSTIDEVKKRQIHRVWKDSNNNIHKALWELYKLAFTEIKAAGQNGDILHTRARDMLAAATPSCSFFWASCRPWWYGVYPENAATGMCLALYSLLAPPAKIKDKAFKIRQDIYEMVKQLNTQGEAKKLQIKYLKSVNIDPKRFFEKQS